MSYLFVKFSLLEISFGAITCLWGLYSRLVLGYLGDRWSLGCLTRRGYLEVQRFLEHQTGREYLEAR
jgi:hypothetical protein